MLEEKLIVTQANAVTSTEILTRLADRLFSKGYVNEKYLDFLLAREEKFPTGLNLGDNKHHIAVPHSEPEHVKHSAIAVATLANPIAFYRMDQPQEEVAVSIVFMFAVDRSDQHVKLLSQLIAMMRNDVLVEKILNSPTPQKLLNLFNQEVEKKGQKIG